jgi:hypothetical protein
MVQHATNEHAANTNSWVGDTLATLRLEHLRHGRAGWLSP